MNATRRPHSHPCYWLTFALIAFFVGCNDEPREPIQAANHSFSGYGYWEKDLDYLFEEYKTNPCVENKLAALEAIRLSEVHLPDSPQLRLRSLHLLYDAAIYARTNWIEEPITVCETPQTREVKEMMDADLRLGVGMQDNILLSLLTATNYARDQKYYEQHPEIPAKARELLYKLEPEDKASWLYSRWKKRVEQLDPSEESENTTPD